jgi:hypothetical protein
LKRHFLLSFAFIFRSFSNPRFLVMLKILFCGPWKDSISKRRKKMSSDYSSARQHSAKSSFFHSELFSLTNHTYTYICLGTYIPISNIHI